MNWLSEDKKSSKLRSWTDIEMACAKGDLQGCLCHQKWLSQQEIRGRCLKIAVQYSNPHIVDFLLQTKYDYGDDALLTSLAFAFEMKNLDLLYVLSVVCARKKLTHWALLKWFDVFGNCELTVQIENIFKTLLLSFNPSDGNHMLLRALFESKKQNHFYVVHLLKDARIHDITFLVKSAEYTAENINAVTHYHAVSLFGSNSLRMLWNFSTEERLAVLRMVNSVKKRSVERVRINLIKKDAKELLFSVKVLQLPVLLQIFLLDSVCEPFQNLQNMSTLWKVTKCFF